MHPYPPKITAFAAQCVRAMPKIIKQILAPPTQILYTPMLLHFVSFKYFKDLQLHIPPPPIEWDAQL